MVRIISLIHIARKIQKDEATIIANISFKNMQQYITIYMRQVRACYSEHITAANINRVRVTLVIIT